jgi:hypothetical protein
MSKTKCDWCKLPITGDIGEVEVGNLQICRFCYEKEKNEDGTIPLAIVEWKKW